VATPSLRYAGIDLGDKSSRLCVLNEAGEIVVEEILTTSPRTFEERFHSESMMRIGIEVGTHSRWTSRLLTRLGHEVIVADSRQLPLITHSDRKTDRRDARVLARLVRVDPHLLSPIAHRSEEHQQDLAVLRSRDQLVALRSRLILFIRGTVKPTGNRLPTADSAYFTKRAASSLPDSLRPALVPLGETIDHLSEQIKAYDQLLKQLATTKYPETARLLQVPGVGPITALGFVLTIGDPHRFHRNRQVGAYFGLRPKQRDSGDSQPQLSINKAGDKYLRSLLVQCSHHLLGPLGVDCELRRWGLRLAGEGSSTAKRRAVVAVARKLSVLLISLWKSGEQYVAIRDSAGEAPAAVAS
jgi:transposase